MMLIVGEIGVILLYYMAISACDIRFGIHVLLKYLIVDISRVRLGRLDCLRCKYEGSFCGVHIDTASISVSRSNLLP
jgi:hypothetical protein